jgi:type I restriction enzyme, S subunit
MAIESPLDHPIEWPATRLGDIALKIGSGATPRGGSESYLPKRSQFALVRSQNVFDRHFDATGLAFISDQQALSLRGVVLQPGDLLLNITGDGITFSRCCAVPNWILPACVNQHVAIIRVNAKVADPGYVLSYLTHPTVKSYIESFNAGGSRRAITKGHIESFQIALPPLIEQRAIACILGTLDEKIELNGLMNKTLESITRALFKSWFVDFDPVHAKVAGSDPGLPKFFADLFPDSLVESDLGEIPKGWTVKSVGELTSYLSRGISPAYVDEGGVLVINQKCVRNGRVETAKGRRHNPNEKSVAGRTLLPGDVLINSTGVGTLGRVAQIVDLDEETIVDSHVTVVRANGVDATWNFLGLALGEREAEIEALGEGSTGQTELSRSRLARLPIVAPRSEVLTEFDRLCLPLRKKAAANVKSAQTLASIRDALLPKLISGELLIPDLKRILGG